MPNYVHFLLAVLLSSCSIQAQAVVDPKDFFSSPSMTAAELSPDGNKVAAIIHDGENSLLRLIDAVSGSQSTLLDLEEFTTNDASIRSLSWIDGAHLAIQFFEVRKGVKNLLDTRNSRYLLVIRLPGRDDTGIKILSVRTPGWLVDSIPRQEKIFYYATSGHYSKIYKIDVTQLELHKKKLGKLAKKDGGQFVRDNEVASIEGYASRWFVDSKGRVSAVLKHDSDGGMSLQGFNDEMEPTGLKTWGKKQLESYRKGDLGDTSKLIMPVAITDEDDTFYGLDFSEEQERSVYKVNYSSGKKELVYESNAYRVIDLILTESADQLIGVTVIQNGGVQSAYLESARVETDAEIINSTAELESIVGTSADGYQKLVYIEAHSQPGHFIWKNDAKGKQRTIGSVFPKLHGRLGSKLVEGTVTVEGLDIPYLLTLPSQRVKEPAPLIVFPHGGPIDVFDDRYFDLPTQFFAANGYAVLRVNFRGSSGYTSQLKEAGKRQWGGLMLEDIYSAALHATGMQEIDAERVCAAGFSYGGYAATMLTIQHPELFRCAVNMAGVSDLNLLLSAPNNNKRQRAWAKEYIGDTEADYDLLKEISPAYLVEGLQQPILIVHGAKDEVVDIEHAYRLKKMLEKHGKPFSWYVFPEGGHSFGRGEDQSELFERVERFVSEHIH